MATLAPDARPAATLGLAEAITLAPIAHARMVGSERFVWLYQLAGLSLGLLAGSLTAGLIAISFALGGAMAPAWLPLDALPLLGGLTGWSVGIHRAQRRHMAKFLAGIRARGTPDSVPVEYAIEDAGLRITTPRADYRIAWDAILEIVPTEAVWLVQVDTTSFLIAKRAFAGVEAERTFMAEILARMRPEARDRSVEAAAFAKSPAATPSSPPSA